jgi:elongation factor P
LADGSIFLVQETYFFMNSETFEELPVDRKVVDDKIDWIEEGQEVNLVFFKGNVIEVVVPQTGLYTIAQTDPNLKGNTAQGYTKPATLSCGAVINVPGYLETGELIKVDTDKRAFIERANK